MNMAALLTICNVLKLARIILFCNAPDGSWINPFEKAMTFFNMPPGGRGFAWEPCVDPFELKVVNADIETLRQLVIDNYDYNLTFFSLLHSSPAERKP